MQRTDAPTLTDDTIRCLHKWRENHYRSFLTAQAMGVSTKWLDNFLCRSQRKLGLANRDALVQWVAGMSE